MTPPADFAALRALVEAATVLRTHLDQYMSRRAARWKWYQDSTRQLDITLPAAQAALERVETDLAELRAEVQEWLCTKCRYVYPGPPQPGFRCVECPRCGGSTGPHATLLCREAEARVARLEEALLNLVTYGRRAYNLALADVARRLEL